MAGEAKVDNEKEKGEVPESKEPEPPKEEPAEKALEKKTSSEDEKPEDHPVEQNADEKAEIKEPAKDTSQSIEKAKETFKGWGAYIPSVRGKKKAEPGQLADIQEHSKDDDTTDKPAKKGWSAYVPSIRGSKSTHEREDTSKPSSWSQYLSAGKGFSSYLPSNVSLSSFAAAHQRDPSKSLAEQLYEFSKTPVGAAGLSVATGSGYASSIFAAYSAYNTHITSKTGTNYGMEFLSMPHSRVATGHLSPQVGDVLVSNLRVPLLAVVEDTSVGVHDTLVAACDPQRYKQLGVQEWASHGSCAENLVLALQELNKRTGLKGQRAIGADVTVNNVPAPMNLFMNAPVSDSGEIHFEAPASKRGDSITFRAERDLVVVMSACPQDVLPINGGRPMVAHFVVESTNEEDLLAQKEREEEVQRVLDKARARTAREKTRGKKPVLKRGRSSGITSGKTALRPGESTPKPPSIHRARSSQTSVQSSTSRASRPAPRKLASGSQASLRRQSSSQSQVPQTSQPQPPQFARRESSQQQQRRFSAPTKETQRVNSPKPKQASSAAGPAQGQGSGSAPTGSQSSPAINVVNAARPGRPKPRKLERRSAA